ncbi:MAG: hypothetical protein NDI67_08790 [Sulfuritalea sp.]|nr:hypothetical protein [Sulfuritalea sp.]
MAKIIFNSFEWFLKKHPESFSFATTISFSAPMDPGTDKRGKKLPTPYGLFQEWAKVSLSGDWVTTKYKGGFIICVADLKDAITITHVFGISTDTLRRTSTGERSLALGYKDSDYMQLARALRYDL